MNFGSWDYLLFPQILSAFGRSGVALDVDVNLLPKRRMILETFVKIKSLVISHFESDCERCLDHMYMNIQQKTQLVNPPEMIRSIVFCFKPPLIAF